MDEELLNQLENFNKCSPSKIQLTVSKTKSDQQVGTLGSMPHMYIMNTSPEYIFTIVDSQNTKYDISTREFVEDAFELSKTICERENEKLKMDLLIRNNCESVIEEHSEQLKNWIEFLMNWEINSRLSVYKSYDKAIEAHKRFSHSLPSKIIEYLEKHNPAAITEIKSLIQHINELTEKIELMIRDMPLFVKRSFSASGRGLYNLAI